MNPTPLDQLRLRSRDHRSALWWLGMLYRRPKHFLEPLQQTPFSQQVRAALRLWLHSLPYIVGVSAVDQMIVLGIPRNPSSVAGLVGEVAFGITAGVAFGIAFGVVGGIAAGITAGIALGIAGGIAFGTAGGIAFGITAVIAIGIATGIAAGIGVGIAVGVGVGIGVGVAFGIAFGIAAGIALGIAGGIAFGTTGGIAGGIAVVIAVLRLYYHPAHLLFVWPKPHAKLYRFHPVAWDDLCPVPFPALDRLLVLYAQENVLAGEEEIERLIDGYPGQRTAALRARVVLLARSSARLTDLNRLDEIIAKLPEGATDFLRQAIQIKGWVAEISRLQSRLNAIDRPIFREPTAHALVTEIENFRHRVAGFEQPLAREFRAAAEAWNRIASRQLKEAQAAVSRKPVRQVFLAGDPIDRNTEAFVPRYSVAGALEQQVMLGTGCPGIVLYGRRRMGKSTVLRNMDGFLPPSVVCVPISMQNPEMFTSLEHLVRHITNEIRSGTKSSGEAHDLPGLYGFLSECNKRLEAEEKRLLLALDEYEIVDRKIKEGIFPLDLLDTLRESIQRHRHITWLVAGSHQITELPNAPWTSYLVSARTIEVHPFTKAETHLLLTEPLKYSTFWPQGSKDRPRFNAEFWGDGGIERIHAEADGWPVLVQLIAETAIVVINDEGGQSVTASVLDRALQQSVEKGENVLSELMRGESLLDGEWEYLATFRKKAEQTPPEDEAVFRSLRRRQLVTEENGRWRLRVPLMARWLRERG